MTNDEIADRIELLGKLMDLHGENSFRAKAYQNAAYNISKMNGTLAAMTREELVANPVIGKSLADKIEVLLNTGHIQQLDELADKTPPGVVEMMRIKGLGPKKVAVIWRELQIDSIGALKNACTENRLKTIKGFGEKTQESVLKNIEFIEASRSKYLYAQLEYSALSLTRDMLAKFPDLPTMLTGEFRRQCEVVDGIELLTAAPAEEVKTFFSLHDIEPGEEKENEMHCRFSSGVPLTVYFSNEEDFGKRIIETTGNAEHAAQVFSLLRSSAAGKCEREIYDLAGLPFIEAELREHNGEIEAAQEDQLPQLIELYDLKGSLHNHSTWSDGVSSIREMSEECMKLGLEYFGICDHSQTATYAKGLSIERVLQQHREIDELNRELAPFRIFKGIESDILYDGSLDYEPDILSTFDFVVASVHSIFGMTPEKATQRVLSAVLNPFTTILGHPTGRLLLTREGYPMDHKTIIDACAEKGVVIELNASPYRLDLDWRWIRYATERGVMISINPDAHNLAGLMDTHYGVIAARKGWLTKEQTLNAFSCSEIEKYFRAKKQS